MKSEGEVSCHLKNLPQSVRSPPATARGGPVSLDQARFSIPAALSHWLGAAHGKCGLVCTDGFESIAAGALG